MLRVKRSFRLRVLIPLFVPLLLTGCGRGGGNSGAGAPPETESTPVIGGVRSGVLSDADHVYPTGRMVRIDVDVASGSEKIVSGTIRITSASQGYDSGVQPLLFGSIFFMWDTTGLNPASDYKALVTLTDSSGQTATDNSLTITLAPNPPAINKLVSDVDVNVPAAGLPVRVVRTYLLDSTFDGPFGYGWTHTYRMRAVETPTFKIIQALPPFNSPGERVPIDGVVQIFNADGTGSLFQPNGDGTYQPPKGDFRTLKKNADGTYMLKEKSGARYDFDAIGRLTRITDRNGNTQNLGYGPDGRVATVTDASGQITTFAYNAVNRITSITDPAGRTVSYSYDNTGNLVSVIKPGGFTTTYFYDAKHNLTTITDPSGKRTFFTVNADDRLETLSAEGGSNKVTFEYFTPTPNQMTVTDALGNQTISTYDNNALVTAVVDPSNNTTGMTYDANLNLTSLTDAKGGVTTFTYDSQGNVLSTTDALGNTMALTYEPSFNRVASLTDTKGNVTSFQYDAKGNLTAMIYPNGASEAFGYDALGNLTRKTDRKGQTINYSYDTKGNLAKKSFPDGTSDSFTYNSAGNLTSTTDENRTINFRYDGSDRLIQVTYPGGEVVSYGYDAAGNRTQLTYPDGMVLNYAYDTANRLTQISSSGQVVATYAYDVLSRVVRRDLQNGTFTTYSYDSSSRLLDLINRKSTSAIISNFSYTYDNVGNRLTMTTLDGKTEYSYDAISQHVSVIKPDATTTIYNFDAAGNRISVIDGGGAIDYTTNNLNQYTDVGGETYTYDANGNMTSKTTSAGTTTYTYDFENQLILVTAPAGIVTYTYDSFGRRTSKITSVGTTKYLHDGLQVIMEKDDGNFVQTSYVHGIGIDEVLLMKKGGIDYFYSQDGLGSVVDLTDVTEKTIESYDYDSYGRVSNITTVGNPYLFVGRELDVETGLYYYRARYYDYTIGRFLTSDPIGFLGGLNFYQYVGNNPINFIDPLGLFQASVDPFGPMRERLKEWKKMVPEIAYKYLCNGTLKIKPVCDRLGKTLGDLIPDGDNSDDNSQKRDAGDGDKNDGFVDWCRVNPEVCENLCNKGFGEFCNGGRGNGDDGNEDGGGGDCNPCVGDPTFIQLPAHRKTEDIHPEVISVSKDLVAKISMPYQNALVRGEIPIFGLAYGREFETFKVEYGSGVDPHEWITIASSMFPQTRDVMPTDFDDSGDVTIHGNLATWDTGLSYVYLPSHPADHPVDLKGTYTVRLVVTGKDGQMAEDRVTVDVADVIPNAWGGTVVSTDKHLTLAVPEQAIRESFRLIAAQPSEKTPAPLSVDRTLIGSVYALREPGERFTKGVKLTMKLTNETVKGHDLNSIGIYAYDEKQKIWEHLDSRRPDGRFEIETAIRELKPYYALMASTKSGEGSRAFDSTMVSAKLERVSAGAASGPYLVKENFEQGTGGWSNRDGDVGAIVTLDKTGTFDGTQALKVANSNGGGNFAVNVGVPSFDARDYPIVQFDYRIPPSVKTNFLVKAAGRWYDIGFTDDPKEFRDKRVNIAHIGNIEGVIADDSWRTARFNLYEMLRTKTGHTFVEEMIMADWDVGGYMKLQFGNNSKGASYFIDNFMIGRDTTAGLRLDEETILVDHFNQKKSTNALGGGADVFSDGKSGRLEYLFREDDAVGKGHSLSISYGVSEEESYAGYITELRNLDLRGFHTLTFYVKAPEEDQNLLVGLKDQTGQERKVAIDAYLSEKVVPEWRRIVIPLAAFSSSLDWGRMQSLSFSFEHAQHPSDGTVLLDQVEFHRAIQYVMVDDFESRSEENLLANKNWTFTHGAAAINGQKAKNSPNGIYAISYGGNIGDVVGHDSGLNYTGWATGLGGIDCSKCETLSFRIRGADGGERPNLYLSDGTFRWGVDVEAYAQVTSEWQEVRIPLKAFSDYGIDLTHLDAVEVVFEWEKMSGTVYLDEIRLGDQKAK